MTAYVDTSAAMKLVVAEAESVALETYLDAAVAGQNALVSSWLLHTELHRAARRHSDLLDEQTVTAVLDTLDLVDLARGDFLTAGSLPWRLRSHDAIHLAVALRIGADEMIGYDVELQQAATDAGLVAASPR